MAKTRENSKLKGVRLPDSLKISGDLDCLKGAELVISATPSFAVRETGKKIAPYLTPETVLVSVSKGIERDTNLRMSQILTEVTGNICKVAALSGLSRRGSKHSDAHRLRVRLSGSESGPAGTGRFHE